MKKVLLRGPLLTYSGYGTHSRQVFRWLMTIPNIDLKVQCLPWGVTPWMVNPDLENGIAGAIMKRTNVSSDEVFDITFQLQLPNEWDPSLGKRNVGLSAVVESDRCNPAWIDCCNRMDHIVVPTHHVKNVLCNTGDVKTVITVIPEAFYDEITEKEIDGLNVEFETDFNFLLFGQLTGNNPENDRKNNFYGIKWLCETFAGDKDVGIVFKTNSGKNTVIDRKITRKILEGLVNEVRQGPYPKIHFLHGAMSQHQIASLYRHPKIKALVALTRGEGFGLPLLEAAASGLPVIATNWSGHLDFLSLGKFIPVDYSLEDIHPTRVDNEIFVEGSKWAQPVEADVKRKLKKFRSSWIKPKQWAKEMQPRIIENYSQRTINGLYDQALGKYFAD